MKNKEEKNIFNAGLVLYSLSQPDEMLMKKKKCCKKYKKGNRCKSCPMNT